MYFIFSNGNPATKYYGWSKSRRGEGEHILIEISKRSGISLLESADWGVGFVEKYTPGIGNRNTISHTSVFNQQEIAITLHTNVLFVLDAAPRIQVALPSLQVVVLSTLLADLQRTVVDTVINQICNSNDVQSGAVDHWQRAVCIVVNGADGQEEPSSIARV